MTLRSSSFLQYLLEFTSSLRGKNENSFFSQHILLTVLVGVIYISMLYSIFQGSQYFMLRVQTVAKRHLRSSMFTASFILVACVKLP